MKIINAMQTKAGAKTERNKMGQLTQPIQFLRAKDKDEDWAAWNMDWYELIGLKQVRRNARRLLKNYKLANGIIDKSDYIVEEDNETADLIETLTQDDESAFDLKFFPIIPNVINVMVGEFAKRNDKITYRTIDDFSYNEMLAQKQEMVEEYLVNYAEQQMQQTIEQMGLNPQDPEQAQQIQQMMTPENLKTLPEIQEFFDKDYRSMVEQWAGHQHNVDEERFKLKELETYAFRDSLITDREFWHFKMNEDDYEMELWNPVLTFYHKSPEVRYISQGNWVGKFDLMSVPDIIDKFGPKMDKRQLEILEEVYPIKSAGYILPGAHQDSYYDGTRSHKWNTTGPSLAMRQYQSFNDVVGVTGDNVVDDILRESEDLLDFQDESLLRVTTAYWKSQKMVGYLTKIMPDGMIKDMIVDESYKILDKAIYDTTVNKKKCRETLIGGEHIEWIWINEVWGGTKIGPNRANFFTGSEKDELQPIYLDVKPVRFQFKGDYSLYGCKLPVEGAVFSDRNSRSVALVDRMKPYQIGYNMTNNQIADILIDEIGTVIMIDQNALPKHSMGEDWGNDQFGKAFVAMKNFQMMPLDTSITNTENATNFNHYQKLDMSQTNRLMSRIQLSNYFKQQCFESIGISQQRLGAVNAQETATGVEQAINMSYSQTEMYFVQHSEYLMPRVHQMRTDLAQYYHSHKPSVRLQYMTSMDEKVNFQINGTDLLLRDLNIFISTKVNQRQIMEQMKQLAIQNNTSGASIHDLGGLLKAESMAEIDNVLKGIEKKADQRVAAEREHATSLQNQQLQAAAEAEEKKLAYEAEQKQLDRDKDVTVAKIRAASATGLVDTDENQQSDYIDTLEYLDKKDARDKDAQLAREERTARQIAEQRELNIKREELQSRERIADTNLKIARENKNKYDKKPSKQK
jgi:hypothetical protein